MKRTYKILFWITLSLLVVTNIYWFYLTIDNAVGQSYYKVSCEEYYKDMIEFKKVLETKTTKKEAIKFLRKNKIIYDSIQKGSNYIIIFNSFGLKYNKNGNLILSKQNE